MLDRSLIDYCAPTLAGIKCANLFNYFFEDIELAYQEITVYNNMLNERGVYLTVLQERHNNLLIYAYRTNHLAKRLNDKEVQALLQDFGYDAFDVNNCIYYLKYRLNTSTTFPHEIGIFLGYPIEDVKCFIEHKGQGCKYCGMWKVYCNVEDCKKLFAQYDKCTSIYKQQYRKQGSLQKMIVYS